MADAGPSNAEIADRLSLFAALLELAETSPFAVRAYVRAAELIRSSPASIAELVRQGRVRELRGIGSGIESKLRELVETGEIAELRELEAELEPELVGYGRMLGLSAKRIVSIARDLDVTTVAELDAAIAAGRLQDATGVGAATESKIRAALERERAAPRALTINRSRALSAAIASALGGEVAGAARRFCELAHELAVVVASDDADGVARPLRLAPDDRDGARAQGAACGRAHAGRRAGDARHRRAVDVRHGALPRDGFRRVRGRARAAARRARRGRPVRARSAFRSARPSCARRPARRRPRTSSTARTSAAISTATRRGPTAARASTRWRSQRGTAGYEYLAICDHTPNVRVVPGPRLGRAASPGGGDRRGQRARRTFSRPPRRRVRHPR